MSLRTFLFCVLPAGVLFPIATADDKPVLAGTWSWEWKGPDGTVHKHILEIEGEGKELAARERFDNEAAIKVVDLKREGKTVSFSVTRGDRRSEYEGTLTNADTINGLVRVSANNLTNEYTWTAKRKPIEKKR